MSQVFDERSAGVLSAVTGLVPGIVGRSDETDQLRRLPDSTVKELTETGLLRLLQPARYGGIEGDPRVLYEAAMRLGAVCGSTGWVAGVVGVHAWQLALFDDRLQRELWSENPDVWASSSYMPGGKLTPVTGGFEVSGRWSFSSGSDHCQWAILGAMHKPEGGKPDLYNIVVPRTDYVVEDTWHTMGLRGTGSNDIVIEKAFVPGYRMLTRDQVYSGNAPGLELNGSPLYRMPFPAMFASVISAPIVGMAEGALALSIDHVKNRVSGSHGRVVDSDPYSVAAIGGAAREIAACRMQLLGNISDLYECVTSGGEPTMELRSRARRDQVLATERSVEAVEELFGRAGAKVIYDGHPLQRIWRDIHAAKQHMINSNERTLHSWAHNAMGLGPSEVIV